MIALLVRTASALVLMASVALGAPAPAQTATTFDVDRWVVYGASYRFAQDSGVPGGGVVRVAPRATPADDWTSGAVVTLPAAFKAGERVSAIFWARADRPTKVPVTLQAGAEPYNSFADMVLDLSPAWQRFILSGVAPSDLAAGSQVFSVQLGKAAAEVSLGPLLVLPGAPGAGRIEAALAAFRPDRVAEDVRIPSDPGVVLAGTLRTPGGHGRGPFPVAVLIQGMGPNGRGGFNLLMDRLLAGGIATLEYDKRGVGRKRLAGFARQSLPSTARWTRSSRPLAMSPPPRPR